jgi:anti-anti-sigma factor
MSVQPEHTGSGETLHPDIDGLAAGSLLSGAIEPSQCAAGEIIVLRVSGEVDLCTIPILQAALDASLDQGPAYLVVDLAQMTFCSVRGLDLLTQIGRITAAAATGYAVTGVLPRIDRVWTLCWGGDRPVHYPAPQQPSSESMRPRPPSRSIDRGRAMATHPDRKISSSGATGFPRRA